MTECSLYFCNNVVEISTVFLKDAACENLFIIGRTENKNSSTYENLWNIGICLKCWLFGNMHVAFHIWGNYDIPVTEISKINFVIVQCTLVCLFHSKHYRAQAKNFF